MGYEPIPRHRLQRQTSDVASWLRPEQVWIADVRKIGGSGHSSQSAPT
jgi:hypothetical protein